MVRTAILIAFLIGCLSQIDNVFGALGGKYGLKCKETCKTGYSCVDGQCKMNCGGFYNVGVECLDGYQCMGDSDPEFGGHCEKYNCGGIGNIPCKDGYWCKIIQNDISDPMGVCTDEICPKGCAIWNDGCNICGCATDGGSPSCTEKFCEKKGTPFCEKEDNSPADR